MTTPRKPAANGENARNSAGSRTRANKVPTACRSGNLGAFLEGCLLPTESEAEFIACSRRLRAGLASFGAVELLLAGRVITAGWWLRRLGCFEAVLVASEGEHPERVFDEGSRSARSGDEPDAWLRLCKEARLAERPRLSELACILRLLERRDADGRAAAS